MTHENEKLDISAVMNHKWFSTAAVAKIILDRVQIFNLAFWTLSSIFPPKIALFCAEHLTAFIIKHLFVDKE